MFSSFSIFMSLFFCISLIICYRIAYTYWGSDHIILSIFLLSPVKEIKLGTGPQLFSCRLIWILPSSQHRKRATMRRESWNGTEWWTRVTRQQNWRASSFYAVTFRWDMDHNTHGLINYIETKAKCRHLKEWTCKGILQQVFIRVFRLEIQSVVLVCSTQLYELLPTSNLLSGSPPPPFPVSKYSIYRQCGCEGVGVLTVLLETLFYMSLTLCIWPDTEPSNCLTRPDQTKA